MRFEWQEWLKFGITLAVLQLAVLFLFISSNPSLSVLNNPIYDVIVVIVFGLFWVLGGFVYENVSSIPFPDYVLLGIIGTFLPLLLLDAWENAGLGLILLIGNIATCFVLLRVFEAIGWFDAEG